MIPKQNPHAKIQVVLLYLRCRYMKTDSSDLTICLKQEIFLIAVLKYRAFQNQDLTKTGEHFAKSRLLK